MILIGIEFQVKTILDYMRLLKRNSLMLVVT